MKQKSYAALKKELDRVWSIWVRKSASVNEYVRCVSCSTKDHWKNMQCGHFIPRHYLAGRWNSDNCWPQCPVCNVFKRGNYPEFAAFLVKQRGPKFLEELIALKREQVKYTRADLQEKINQVKAEIERLP